MTWIGADTEKIALAVTGVNSVLWDLGHRVISCHGDAAASPGWAQVALERRQQTLAQFIRLGAAHRPFAFQ